MKIKDCPCDKCDFKTKCGPAATECRAVKNFYDTGWYMTSQMKKNLKPMKNQKEIIRARSQ